MGLYIGGYDPIKMIEALLNTLINSGMISREQAEAIVQAGKAPVKT